MAKHYLANRKPQRKARILEKAVALERDGVSLDLVEHDHGSRRTRRTGAGPAAKRKHSISLPNLLGPHYFDSLGYRFLCEIETSLDEIRRGYENAKSSAIAVIAHLAGELSISGTEVLAMARNAHPARFDDPQKPHSRRIGESDPFAWHAHAFDNWAFVSTGCWDELVHLTLTELRVLYLQLREIAAADKRNRIPAPATLAAISGPVQRPPKPI